MYRIFSAFSSVPTPFDTDPLLLPPQGVDIQGSTTSLGASGDECLSDSGTSGYESCSSEELSERERRLAHLRRLARDLEASLHPSSQAWVAITKVSLRGRLQRRIARISGHVQGGSITFVSVCRINDVVVWTIYLFVFVFMYEI